MLGKYRTKKKEEEPLEELVEETTEEVTEEKEETVKDKKHDPEDSMTKFFAMMSENQKLLNELNADMKKLIKKDEDVHEEIEKPKPEEK
jgi:hypothetical protein